MPYHRGMEKLRNFCESGGMSGSELARSIGVSAPTVAEWCSGRRPVPIARCFAIERATGGVVTRRDLRPDDWQDIWPELDGAQATVNAQIHPQAPASQALAATENVAVEVAHG